MLPLSTTPDLYPHITISGEGDSYRGSQLDQLNAKANSNQPLLTPAFVLNSNNMALSGSHFLRNDKEFGSNKAIPTFPDLH